MKTLGVFVVGAILMGAGATLAASPLDKLDRLDQPDPLAKEQPRRQEAPPPASKPTVWDAPTKPSLEPSEPAQPTKNRTPEEIKKERSELDKELGDLLRK